MKFTLATLSLVASFVAQTSAHLIMEDPPQWVDTSGEAQFPLSSQARPEHKEGLVWPCGSADPGSSVITYEPGSEAKLKIIGGATHGGGSAQMVITYDLPVSESSVWRVLKSFEGNHPGGPPNDNASPDASYAGLPEHSFPIPEDLPSGDAVVAWSWYNKLGNREHYQKCATVTIGGSNTDKAGWMKLPTMFQANDDSAAGSQCQVPAEIEAIKFKNPGPVVEGEGTTPIDCDSSEAGSESGTTTEQPTTTSAPSYNESGAATEVPAASSTSSAAGVSYTAPATTSTPATTEGGACTEGAYVCGSGTYQMCGSGRLWDMGAIPTGWTCSEATGIAPVQKRNVRFSAAHKHKRHTHF